MKAGHIVEPRRLEIVEAPLPSLDDFAGEPVLVKLRTAALCGSDFPRFLGGMFDVTFPRPVCDSLHEIIGEVVESRSDRFQPGDQVMAIPPDHRGLSEYFLADASMVIPLPDYEPREHLVLAQPLGTVIWACRKLGPVMHQDAVVIGQGPIGLMFNQLLSNLGARRIIALDKLDYRLELGRKLKATHTFNVDRDDARDAVMDLTGGRGADIVVEAVGQDPETVRTAIDLAARDGAVVMFGLPKTRDYALPVWDVMYKNLRFIGSVHPEAQRDWPLALDMVTQGRIDVASLITHRLPFTEAQRAFMLAVDKDDRPVKVLLEADGDA